MRERERERERRRETNSLLMFFYEPKYSATPSHEFYFKSSEYVKTAYTTDHVSRILYQSVRDIKRNYLLYLHLRHKREEG